MLCRWGKERGRWSAQKTKRPSSISLFSGAETNKHMWRQSVSLYAPEVVPLAEYEVPLGVQRGSDLPQPAVAAAALETVLVPVQVKGLQKVPVYFNMRELIFVLDTLVFLFKLPVLYLLPASRALLHPGRLLGLSLHRHGHLAAKREEAEKYSLVGGKPVCA